MRSASLFFSRFWIGGTGRELVRRFTRDHVVVAVYLFTGPSSHMSGLYYLPVATITEHTGIGTAKVRRILDDLDRIGFARYDHAAAMVWVVSMARWQISDSLRAADKRVWGLRRYLRGLPRSVLVADFLRVYALDLDDPASPTEAPSEPHRRGDIPISIPSPAPSAGRAGRRTKKSGGAR